MIQVNTFKANGMVDVVVVEVFDLHTIKDESYPLITAYYIVTLKGRENGAVSKVKEAMLESKGQEIARNAGYIEIN